MSVSVKGTVGEMSVGEMSVGEVSVEQRSQCRGNVLFLEEYWDENILMNIFII